MADFTPHEAPAHEAASLPVRLPAKLVGRDMVLAKTYAHLKDNMPVLVFGPAGAGKTALAATLASAYTELPGGVLWIHADQPSLAQLLVQVGRAYQEPEITNSENPVGMVGAVANTLTRHKPLIVIDGRYDVPPVQDFISRCADGLPVLLLSDEQIVGPWTPVALGALEPGQAAEMFKVVAGMDRSDSEESDPDIEQLVEAVAHMPLGIAVAAGAVRGTGQPPAQFLGGMPRQPGVSGQLLALTAAFRTLNSALQGLLLMMGATPRGEASAELVSMISGVPIENIQQALSLLVERQLAEKLTRYTSTYYRLHPVTYAFTQPLLRGSNKLDPLREKVRDTLLTYARTFSSSTPPAYNHLAMEMENFLAIARWAADQGDRETANQLAVTLMQAGDFVQSRGYVYELLLLRRLAAMSTSAFPAYTVEAEPSPLPYEDVEEDEELEEDAEEVEIEGRRQIDLFAEDEEDVEDEEADDLDDDYPSLPYDLLGFDEDEDIEDDDEGEEHEDEDEVAAAVDEDAPGEAPEEAGPLPEPELPEIQRLRQSLSQARHQGNQHRQAEILNQIGQTQIQAGMENEAISTFIEALTVYDEIQDQGAILRTLDILSTLAARTENSQAAVLYAMRGIPLAEQTADRGKQIKLLTTLGDARQQLGESTEAAGAYAQALELARTAGSPEQEAMILLRLGYAYLDDDRPQDAVSVWEYALNLFKEQGKRDLEGRVLGGLGTAYGELNRWQEAIAFHTSALVIAREVQDKEEEALQLSNLGYASVQAQQLGQAVLRYRQALHLAYEMNNRENTVATIVDLVQLLVESARHLKIAELLINDAAKLDPGNRDVKRLKERVEEEIETAQANPEISFIPVGGTAEEYAENAYRLLEG